MESFFYKNKPLVIKRRSKKRVSRHTIRRICLCRKMISGFARTIFSHEIYVYEKKKMKSETNKGEIKIENTLRQFLFLTWKRLSQNDTHDLVLSADFCFFWNRKTSQKILVQLRQRPSFPCACQKSSLMPIYSNNSR